MWIDFRAMGFINIFGFKFKPMCKLYLFIPVGLIFFCSFALNAQKADYKTNYDPAEFTLAIISNPQAPLIDVRTPEEFAKGHIDKALNYDWYGKNFDKQLSSLDKKTPVLVYCLSGGRSAAAAAKMRSEGFEKVYELDGGMMKWRAAGLSEISDAVDGSGGMSLDQFKKLLNPGKTVLVDFYADWCVPCKKMKPYLEEISRDMAHNVSVVRINVDENKELCNQLKIEAIPVLQIYKQGIMTWDHTGYIGKKQVVAQLK